MASSDFLERLNKLRGAKHKSATPPSPSQPMSLSDQLQRAKASTGPLSEPESHDIPIQEAPPEPPQYQEEPNTYEEPVQYQEAQYDTQEQFTAETLNYSDIPQAQQSNQNELSLWTPENGGTCGECNTYNPGHVAFCGSCGSMLMKSEVKTEIITSYPLKEIKGVVHTFIDKLAELNVHTTEDLLRVGLTKQNRVILSKKSGMSERSLVRLVHLSDLCRVPSLEPDHIAMLEVISIHSMSDLRSTLAKEIYQKLQRERTKISQMGIMYFPTKSQVKQWKTDLKQTEDLNIQL